MLTRKVQTNHASLSSGMFRGEQQISSLPDLAGTQTLSWKHCAAIPLLAPEAAELSSAWGPPAEHTQQEEMILPALLNIFSIKF